MKPPVLAIVMLGCVLSITIDLSAQNQPITKDEHLDSFEPNNDIAHATQVEFGKPIQLTFHQPNDVDILRFKVQQRGLVTWQLDQWTGQGSGPHVYYCDASGKQLPQTDYKNLYVTEPGEYGIVLVSNRYSWESYAVLQPFSWQLNFQAIDDPMEPNNTLQTATPIELGKAVTLRFMTRDDNDWLRIDCTGNGTLDLSINNWIKIGDSFRPYPWWYDDAGKIIREGFYDLRVSKGVYYLQLSSSRYQWEKMPQLTPFEVVVDFSPQDDASEPNNTLQTAKPVTLGQKQSMRLRPQEDVDVLKVDVTGQGLLECLVENWDIKASGMNTPNFTFYDANGTKIAERVNRVLAKRGTYYIAINAAPYSWEILSIRKPFDVTVTWKPEGDAYEPNNDIAHATEALFGKEYKINIVPEYDVDIFALTIDKSTRIACAYWDYVAPERQAQSPGVTFYGANQKELEKDSKGTVAVEPGICYVQIATNVYSWERRYMTGLFTVRFLKDVTGAAPVDDIQSSSPEAIKSKQTTEKMPATNAVSQPAAKRKVKRGQWIFEVEKVQ